MITKCQLGIPNRTYFELYVGEHPSEKIYSVQVKDWQKYFSKEKPLKNQEIYENKVERIYEETPAVVDINPNQTLKSKEAHIWVSPTDELVKFMALKGIELPDELCVQPLAFDWEDGECDIEIEDEITVTPVEKKKSNTKTILAIALAVLSLLNK